MSGVDSNEAQRSVDDALVPAFPVDGGRNSGHYRETVYRNGAAASCIRDPTEPMPSHKLLECLEGTAVDDSDRMYYHVRISNEPFYFLGMTKAVIVSAIGDDRYRTERIRVALSEIASRSAVFPPGVCDARVASFVSID
jgi:hypothetical protein